MVESGVKRMNIQATGLRGRPANKQELEYDLKVINTIAGLTREHSIVPCLHPHFNTSVMYESEIDFIMQNTDPSLVAFGPDTAHLVAGKCDPVKMIGRYADRVKFIHLKDITSARIEAEGTQAGVEVYSANVFRELGEGIIDFPAIFRILDDAGYDEFLTVELDRSRFTNKESAVISMKYLKEHYRQD